MAEHIINLTDSEEQAYIEMLGSGFNLETHLKKKAKAHIRQKLDKEWASKTLAEKQTLLGS